MSVRIDSLAEIQKDTTAWCYNQKEFTVNEFRAEFRSRLTKDQSYNIIYGMIKRGNAKQIRKRKNKKPGHGDVNLYRYIGRVDWYECRGLPAVSEKELRETGFLKTTIVSRFGEPSYVAITIQEYKELIKNEKLLHENDKDS